MSGSLFARFPTVDYVSLDCNVWLYTTNNLVYRVATQGLHYCVCLNTRKTKNKEKETHSLLLEQRKLFWAKMKNNWEGQICDPSVC